VTVAGVTVAGVTEAGVTEAAVTVAGVLRREVSSPSRSARSAARVWSTCQRRAAAGPVRGRWQCGHWTGCGGSGVPQDGQGIAGIGPPRAGARALVGPSVAR
jgi:hypothetical protein